MTSIPVPEEVVERFVDWRISWYVERYKKLLKEAETELNFNKAIKECFVNNLPKTILTLSSKQEVIDVTRKITIQFKLADNEIDKIVSMPIYKWTKDTMEQTDKKIDELNLSIADYQDILSKDSRIRKIFKDEVLSLKKMKF